MKTINLRSCGLMLAVLILPVIFTAGSLRAQMIEGEEYSAYVPATPVPLLPVFWGSSLDEHAQGFMISPENFLRSLGTQLFFLEKSMDHPVLLAAELKRGMRTYYLLTPEGLAFRTIRESLKSPEQLVEILQMVRAMEQQHVVGFRSGETSETLERFASQVQQQKLQTPILAKALALEGLQAPDLTLRVLSHLYDGRPIFNDPLKSGASFLLRPSIRPQTISPAIFARRGWSDSVNESVASIIQELSQQKNPALLISAVIQRLRDTDISDTDIGKGSFGTAATAIRLIARDFLRGENRIIGDVKIANDLDQLVSSFQRARESALKTEKKEIENGLGEISEIQKIEDLRGLKWSLVPNSSMLPNLLRKATALNSSPRNQKSPEEVFKTLLRFDAPRTSGRLQALADKVELHSLAVRQKTALERLYDRAHRSGFVVKALAVVGIVAAMSALSIYKIGIVATIVLAFVVGFIYSWMSGLLRR